MAPAKAKKAKAKDITLKDVVVHMQHMEQRLTSAIDQNSRDIRHVEAKLTTRIDSLEDTLTRRMDALEDLTATIQDTVKIRRHVGMALPDEE
jgi:hypothetical protein